MEEEYQPLAEPTVDNVRELHKSAHGLLDTGDNILPTSPGGALSTNSATVASIEPMLVW